ncbi:MAG: hypothetical protein A3A33_01555 [Candidatus Yanofskybacteria bacterium RIFCSPLOWO2_01_FULL_49_25]|uniref:Carbamoyltransferase n=1 Tax=Candidatus Yanofskybacteria bacterium RIFCSPLOWO2_01_FULL_49_25 TaxID=1802701 RepID=A0A1F8GYB4_9BACT|nr:MAG: hypothetical protein A3A33_01555 [Candidatus Yanofskybacteria bacterium RIFCSPLOWO2_01_FULL_49_25]
MNILGISCFYHDSAACLIKDGHIVAAAQEERFTRKKHDERFPIKAIEYCLKEGGITIDQVDILTFYDKPFLKFERLLETYLSYAPRGLRSFLLAMPVWLKEKLWVPSVIKKEIGYKGKIIFAEHHQSHAASAFYPSPFQEAAILTIDGVGEWATASYGIGKDKGMKIEAEIHFPHSLGLLYSAFTYYTGFKVNSGEYKVMGLAPYGKPIYVGRIYKYLVDLKEDGSFRLNMEYFNYAQGLTMTNNKFHQLFGGPPRKPESKLTQREMDIARSIQDVTEEIMLRLARYVHQQTGQKNLCLAGGVALNCVANGRILREGPFEDIWIQPAAGDAGGALGAALFVWHQELNNARSADGIHDTQCGSYLGPSYTNTEVKHFLDMEGISYRELQDSELFNETAGLLAQQKVIGWFSGRMEFGPRALGNRSIIGDARDPNMQKNMNLKIKFRESFRPFAPSVLAEYAPKYFDIDRPTPYMLLTASVKKKIIPAVTHIDNSARPQTVHAETNPRFHNLLEAFRKKTDCPVIVNTSFNVRGEPIVCTPEDAYRCFMRTDMDYLVLENFLIDKTKQHILQETDNWRSTYELD